MFFLLCIGARSGRKLHTLLIIFSSSAFFKCVACYFDFALFFFSWLKINLCFDSNNFYLDSFYIALLDSAWRNIHFVCKEKCTRDRSFIRIGGRLIMNDQWFKLIIKQGNFLLAIFWANNIFDIILLCKFFSLPFFL